MKEWEEREGVYLDYPRICRAEWESGKYPRITMLCRNEIPGILPLGVYREDGEENLCYDITGYISLEQWCRTGELREKHLCWILQELLDIWTIGEAYLLGTGSYCLEAERIFLKPEEKKVKLCVRPEGEGHWQEMVQELARFFLEAIDYKEEECVKLAYEFYHISRKEELGIRDIRELLTDRNYTVIPDRPEPAQAKENGGWICIEADRLEVTEGKGREIKESREKRQQKIRVVLAGLAVAAILFALYQSGF
jgi:hypothetical protein